MSFIDIRRAGEPAATVACRPQAAEEAPVLEITNDIPTAPSQRAPTAPSPATANTLRAYAALAATTAGFLDLYRLSSVAWTLTVPLGTPLWEMVRDFARLTRRLRRRYPQMHMVWTLAAHAPSCHPHYHFLINGTCSRGAMSKLLRGTVFGITYRRELSPEEYEEGSRYNYLASNLYRTRMTNAEGMRHQRLWGVEAGPAVKAAVRRQTRSIRFNGFVAKLWRSFQPELLADAERGLLPNFRGYIGRFYGLPDDSMHRGALDVLVLSRPRSARTGRRPLSLAQFRQRVMYERFRRRMPWLRFRLFLSGFTWGMGTAGAALLVFYTALFSCFLAPGIAAIR